MIDCQVVAEGGSWHSRERRVDLLNLQQILNPFDWRCIQHCPHFDRCSSDCKYRKIEGNCSLLAPSGKHNNLGRFVTLNILVGFARGAPGLWRCNFISDEYLTWKLCSLKLWYILPWQGLYQNSTTTGKEGGLGRQLAKYSCASVHPPNYKEPAPEQHSSSTMQIELTFARLQRQSKEIALSMAPVVCLAASASAVRLGKRSLITLPLLLLWLWDR